jgi:hypothetical protein
MQQMREIVDVEKFENPFPEGRHQNSLVEELDAESEERGPHYLSGQPHSFDLLEVFGKCSLCFLKGSRRGLRVCLSRQQFQRRRCLAQFRG